MSTITRERAQEIFLGNGPEPTASEERELARIAQASLEAEPAGTFRKGPCGYYPSFHEDAVPLYTAPPASVSVPDDVMAAMQKVARIRLDLNDFDGDRRGIAECLGEAEEALIEVVNRRAAMLQGADGNSPVIPDGWIPVSERMPGSQEWVIVFAKWGNQQVLCWDDVANRWTDFEDQSYYADMFTHWMPLPAAPQQEVK